MRKERNQRNTVALKELSGTSDKTKATEIHKAKLTSENNALLQKFQELKAKHEAETDLDKANAMIDDVE